MKPIDNISIAKSINFFKSLTPEEKVRYCEKIQQLQPFAFRTIIAMMREGVSVQKLEATPNIRNISGTGMT
jgi:hypothetical protein